MARRRARGFTLVEALAVVGVGVCFAATVAAGRGQPAGGKPDGAPAAKPEGMTQSLLEARAAARQLKCSTQVRGVVQSLVVWANNNKGRYPLPSTIDAENQTVAEEGRAKDTTANILSILIFNGNISPELCVCPDERNERIASDKNYSYTAPPKAVTPEGALWDPAFRADFTGRKRGNVSYAQLEISEGRLPAWSDTFSTTEAVFGDRGPKIADVAVAEDRSCTPKFANPKSTAMRIHGEPDTWEGNIGYNDGHVEFQTSVVSEVAYVLADDTTLRDTFFFDEPNDPKAKNIYLGIFTKAGTTPKEFKAIWD